jgi:DNA repair exonuclease SbcCD ATPase subunit
MFNPQRLIADLDAVYIQFPDLAEDEALRDHVLAHGTDFESAIKTCLRHMLEAEGLEKGLDHLISTFNQRKARLSRKQHAMRALIQKIMEHAQTTKYTLPEATLSLSQRPSHVIITDEAMLPDDFVRTKTEPNKTDIKIALLNGLEVPGAVLSNGGVGLTIRCK